MAATVVADMLQYLDAQGIPRHEAMSACAIDPDFASGPDHRVAGGRVEELWRFAISRTRDSLIGLHMTEAYNPGALDILGYVILSAPTIGDVLDRVSRYARILNDGLRIDIERERTVVSCRCTFVESMDNYLLRTPDQAIDSIWTGFARELRRLSATPLLAKEVSFRRTAPSAHERREYERVFAAPLRFGAREDLFVIPAAHAALPVRSANPALLQAFERHADELLSSMARRDLKSHQVAQVLATRLKGSVPALSEIAKELAMSDRNLQRALRNDGTSFQRVLDEVRHGLAIRHLADPATSAGQVGFLLGFSEPSAFHRAFRRWTGQAPSAYRAAQAE